MKPLKSLIHTAVASLLALQSVSAPANIEEEEQLLPREKCAGIVKAWMNDCGTSKHTCADVATIDKHPEEWIGLPVGTCDKIIGGNNLGTEEAGMYLSSVPREKCAGIVKAGMNDCGTQNHTCANAAKTEADKQEWIYLPQGSCERIVGGIVLKETQAKNDKK